MFNFIYIYSFIPMSGCVGMGPSALLFPRARDADAVVLLHFFKFNKQMLNNDYSKTLKGRSVCAISMELNVARTIP
jgi:hypothetical protein